MIYGAAVVIFMLSILIHATKPTMAPQQQLLQIQAKDAVMEWFYSSPVAVGTLATSCSAASFKPCACSSSFRPQVTTVLLDPAASGAWVEQKVCVESP